MKLSLVFIVCIALASYTAFGIHLQAIAIGNDSLPIPDSMLLDNAHKSKTIKSGKTSNYPNWIWTYYTTNGQLEKGWTNLGSTQTENVDIVGAEIRGVRFIKAKDSNATKGMELWAFNRSSKTSWSFIKKMVIGESDGWTDEKNPSLFLDFVDQVAPETFTAVALVGPPSNNFFFYKTNATKNTVNYLYRPPNKFNGDISLLSTATIAIIPPNEKWTGVTAIFAKDPKGNKVISRLVFITSQECKKLGYFSQSTNGVPLKRCVE